MPHEELVLGAWRDSLGSNERLVLAAQLGSVRFIQRQAGGAKVCFYYSSNKKIPTFANASPNFNAATVFMRDSKGISKDVVRAAIFIHRGVFFSIEFPKRPKRYFELHGIDIRDLRVDRIEQCM